MNSRGSSTMGEGRVHYRIWAREGDRANLVYFDERSMPESMRPLVRFLRSEAATAMQRARCSVRC